MEETTTRPAAMLGGSPACRRHREAATLHNGLPAAIVADKVCKSFVLHGKSIQVLDGVSATFNQGEVALIAGRSGAGKSTLLALLAGLDTVDSGNISLLGNDICVLDNEALAALRRRSIGFVFQNFQLLPSWTAAENVESVLLHSGLERSHRLARVETLLTRLGLQDRMGNLPQELSIGQQQRVALARTLVNEPKIIFGDEPTGDVDQETAGEMLELLLGAVRDSGATLVVATHGAFPAGVADRRFQLQEGRLEQQL